MRSTNATPPVLVKVGAHEVTAVTERVQRPDFRVEVVVDLALIGIPCIACPLPIEEFGNAGVGLVRMLENKTTS